MPKAIPSKVVNQILSSILEDKMSPADVAEKFGVSLPTVYAKLHESGVSKEDWKHSGIRRGRFHSPEAYHKFLATFRAFYDRYRNKEQLPIAECIDIWNNEVNTEGNFPPINSLATFQAWRVNHLTDETPYHRRKRQREQGQADRCSDVGKEVASLSIFLGIPKHEVIAKAVSALRASIIKASQSL
jgi:hypothetical protein